MTLDEYREHVLRLAKEGSTDTIFNGSSEHAAIVTEIMLEEAENEVCILSNEFDPQVYAKPDVIRAATQFLSDTRNKLNLLIEKDLTHSEILKNPFLDVVRRYSNVSMRHVSEDRQKDYNYNFAVVDNVSIRFESDRKDHNAVVSFKRKKDASLLKSIFDDIWEFASEDTFLNRINEQPDQNRINEQPEAREAALA